MQLPGPEHSPETRYCFNCNDEFIGPPSCIRCVRCRLARLASRTSNLRSAPYRMSPTANFNPFANTFTTLNRLSANKRGLTCRDDESADFVSTESSQSVAVNCLLLDVVVAPILVNFSCLTQDRIQYSHLLVYTHVLCSFNPYLDSPVYNQVVYKDSSGSQIYKRLVVVTNVLREILP